MTDLETQVEALMEGITMPGLKPWLSFIKTRALLTSLVQEKAELARENFVMAGERSFILGNDIPETIERARLVLLNRATAAEARLAAVEQERDAFVAHAGHGRAHPVTEGRMTHNQRLAHNIAQIMADNMAKGLCPYCGGGGVVANRRGINRTGDPHLNRRCRSCKGTGQYHARPEAASRLDGQG